VTDTLSTAGGRTVLRMQRRLAHPQATVWRAITEPDHLAHWFPFTMELDLQPDGKITFLDQDGTPSGYGVVTELEPPRVFAFSWGDDLLRWELRPDGDGCLLTLHHTFDDRAGAASFAAGWHTCIEALDATLDGRTATLPRTMAEFAQLHEDRIALFGLDRGTIEETPNGWQIRFERQLTQPVDAVWTMLAGPTTPAPGEPPPPGFTTDPVPAGPTTACEPPRLLEYETPAADGRQAPGHIRWDLRNGTGDGARLVLIHAGSGGPEAERDTALAAWHDHIERLATRAATA